MSYVLALQSRPETNAKLGGGEPKFQEEWERNLLVVMEVAQSTVSVSPREPPVSMDSTEMGKYQVTNTG